MAVGAALLGLPVVGPAKVLVVVVAHGRPETTPVGVHVAPTVPSRPVPEAGGVRRPRAASPVATVHVPLLARQADASVPDSASRRGLV